MEDLSIPDISAPVRKRHSSWPDHNYLYTFHWYKMDRNVIIDTLREVGGDNAVDRVTNSVLGHLLKVERVKSDQSLHHLLGCLVDSDEIPENELWFLVGDRLVKFSAKDFALITGLQFGRANFQYVDKKYQTPPSSSLHTSHFKYSSQAKLKVVKLYEEFKEKRLVGVENYIKASLLILCYCTVLCREDCTIDAWAWHLVEDIDQWNAYPWGSISFLTLMSYVKGLESNIDFSKYRFHGPAWVLQLWSYEAIIQLGELCAEVIHREAIPRCLKWSCIDVTADFRTFFTSKDVSELNVHEPSPNKKLEKCARV